jgi:hypothetical protein
MASLASLGAGSPGGVVTVAQHVLEEFASRQPRQVVARPHIVRRYELRWVPGVRSDSSHAIPMLLTSSASRR